MGEGFEISSHSSKDTNLRYNYHHGLTQPPNQVELKRAVKVRYCDKDIYIYVHLNIYIYYMFNIYIYNILYFIISKYNIYIYY